ncbi:porin [Porticoccaceae bacterium LTM1]|nr:porin [Porticoccaceae bacterium LTM1]
MRTNKLLTRIALGLTAITLSNFALAEEDTTELLKRLEQLQKEVDYLRQQIQKSATKQEVQEVERKVEAAAEWKQPNTLVHLAGYVDVGYSDSESQDGSFNLGTFSPIFHFQYRDLVMVESELELELEEDGETEAKLEYLTVDWFINDYVALVAGRFLSPIGQFRQNLHPSWINKLPSAPPGFGEDGAAPVSDTGFQLRGGFPIEGMKANYALFIGNGPELAAEMEVEGGDIEFELEAVEAEGFNSDKDGEKVIGGRFGLLPFNGFEVGLSYATGKATVTMIEDGDSSLLNGEAARDYDVAGIDFAWQSGGLDLRGEYVRTKVGADNGSGVAASEGAEWKSWYIQGAYRLPKKKWEIVTRFTDFNSPHKSQEQDQWSCGVNYLFTSNFIGKLSYEFNDGARQSDTDKDRLLLQMAYGF